MCAAIRLGPLEFPLVSHCAYPHFCFFAMQVFYSGLCGNPKFGDLEMVSPPSSEESEEKSLPPHLAPLTPLFPQPGSPRPDCHLVGEAALPGLAGLWVPRLGTLCSATLGRRRPGFEQGGPQSASSRGTQAEGHWLWVPVPRVVVTVHSRVARQQAALSPRVSRCPQVCLLLPGHTHAPPIQGPRCFSGTRVTCLPAVLS